MEGITMAESKKAVSIKYNDGSPAPEIASKAEGLEADELIQLGSIFTKIRCC